MTEDEARKIAQALELVGLPGRSAPSQVDGSWQIVDEAGRDITLQSLDALIEHLGGDRTEPGWHNGRPVRGFVIPEDGRS